MKMKVETSDDIFIGGDRTAANDILILYTNIVYPLNKSPIIASAYVTNGQDDIVASFE
jgi:hypothetical protein